MTEQELNSILQLIQNGVNINADENEYSCAVKPHVRSDGNRQSGTRKPLSASLLA